jgi:hypothetical protein
MNTISGRRVIVDACVSRVLAESLKQAGLKVRHVADINTALKDHEIAKLMHPDEVLITRDYRFYKMLGDAKAILLAARSDAMQSRKSIKKERDAVRKRKRLPSHIRILLRERLAEEERTGLMYAKIFWGITWLLGFPVP